MANVFILWLVWYLWIDEKLICILNWQTVPMWTLLFLSKQYVLFLLVLYHKSVGDAVILVSLDCLSQLNRVLPSRRESLLKWKSTPPLCPANLMFLLYQSGIMTKAVLQYICRWFCLKRSICGTTSLQISGFKRPNILFYLTRRNSPYFNFNRVLYFGTFVSTYLWSNRS